MVILFKLIVMLIGSNLQIDLYFKTAQGVSKALAFQIGNYQTDSKFEKNFKTDSFNVILTIQLIL